MYYPGSTASDRIVPQFQPNVPPPNMAVNGMNNPYAAPPPMYQPNFNNFTGMFFELFDRLCTSFKMNR